MADKRRLARFPVGGRVSLRSSGLTGRLCDISERGIGVMLQGPPSEPIGKRERILISPEPHRTGSIDFEAEMKWFNEGPRSTILGYEIKSFRDERQRDKFRRLALDRHSGTDPSVPE
ncbi:MAG TPA: PilZ domain-containing protein [Rectinemataceae bacterium]|nr:PilZ domain-containing protein [Rectinemataceae bacterium]